MPDNTLPIERWVSIPEAEALLGTTRQSIHRYLRTGRLTTFKIADGRRTVLDRVELDSIAVARPASMTGTESAAS